MSDETRGTPVGRRVFLSLLGVGAAGVVFGSRVQDWLESNLAPIISKDGSGFSSLLPIGRFRIYSVTGDLPQPEPRQEYTPARRRPRRHRPST